MEPVIAHMKWLKLTYKVKQKTECCQSGGINLF